MISKIFRFHAHETGRSRPLGFSLFLVPVLALGLSGCASKILKADNSHEILRNEEFEQALSIKELPEEPTLAPSPTPTPSPVAETEPPKKKPAPSKAVKKAKSEKKESRPPSSPTPSPTPRPREPEMEDSKGFSGRRPVVDPYRVGEKVTLEVSYFSVVAGDMTLEVRPFVEVNGRKSYRFAGTAVSTSVFALFYAVDDWFETFVDFEKMIPYSYALHVKESKQLRETRTLFKWDSMTAAFWDKKINAEKRVEERNSEWDILEYSQNVFSAPFYIRSFQLVPGKKINFRVAHEKENLIVKAEVLRRERIATPAGEFNTVVVKPQIELNGFFKPVGDIFLWFTDDDRKLLVRMESKIKIGKIVAVAKKVEPGSP